MNWKYLAIGIGVVVIVGAAGAAYWFWNNQTPEPVSETPKKEQLTKNENIVVEREEYASNEKCRSKLFEYAEWFSNNEPSEGRSIRVPNFKKEVTCHFVIHPELPEYTIHVVGETGENKMEQVEIYPKDDPAKKKVFTDFVSYYPADSFEVETQDVNFDGYSDIRTPAWYGTIGHLGWHYWVFDPVEQVFELREDLGFANPKLLPETKEIQGDSGIYRGVIYRWEGRELIFDRIQWTDGKEYKVSQECREKSGGDLLRCLNLID